MLPANHHTTYTVNKYDTDVGEISNQLQHQDGTTTYTSKAIATGFAAFFVKEEINETSTLVWSQNTSQSSPHQSAYDLTHRKKHKKDQHITFKLTDKGSMDIDGSYKQQAYQLKSETTVWSRHLLPILMSNDLLQDNNRSSNTFQITDKGDIDSYTYTREKTEKLSIADKTYNSVKFTISAQGSNRTTHVWLAKSLDYLPVKIEQYKGSELNASMLLKNHSVIP